MFVRNVKYEHPHAGSRVAYIENHMAHMVADARERFLESGELPRFPVRVEITESWRRSRVLAVGSKRVDPPYLGGIDGGSLLHHAAKPMLDRLEATLGVGMSALLSNAQGLVEYRSDGDTSLARKLDRVQLAPGFSYSEDHVGTNGIGTSLFTHQPQIIMGTEHFNEQLDTLACAAAPIRDVVRRSVVGLLNVTSWHQDVHPLVQPAVYDAVNAIEQRLLSLGSQRERAVYAEFRAACQQSWRNTPIVAVSNNLMMTNAQATNVLDAADHATVRDAVTELLPSGHSGVAHAVLSQNDPVTLHYRPVTTTTGTAGAVVEIHFNQLRQSDQQPIVTTQPLSGRSSSRPTIAIPESL